MIQDLYILIDLMHHTFYFKISSLRNDTAEFISANAITFPIAFKIVLYDMCRVDNILIPCPMAILIVTLLKIIQVKGHYDIPFKILLIFHKIIISISIVHAGHGIIQGKLFQLLHSATFFQPGNRLSGGFYSQHHNKDQERDSAKDTYIIASFIITTHIYNGSKKYKQQCPYTCLQPLIQLSSGNFATDDHQQV